MWEELEIYHQLDKKEIPKAFKFFGQLILENLKDSDYKIVSTTSTIKLFKEKNNLEFSVFLLRTKGDNYIQVNTCIKPIDYIHKHKFTMLNIVSLGQILNNFRRNSFPLTKEYQLLSIYLAKIIDTKVESYFNQFNNWQKIIENKSEIEPKHFGDNKYGLLIYAAIWTKDKKLLINYIDKYLESPVRIITQSEYLKPDQQEINENDFYKQIRALANEDKFLEIQELVKN